MKKLSTGIWLILSLCFSLALSTALLFSQPNKELISLQNWLYEISDRKYSLNELKNMKSLNLSSAYHKTLTKLPKEIGQLKSLKHLYLAANRLKELPVSLSNLKKLVLLDVSDNKLHSIPEELGQLKGLEYLFLSYNKLRKLPWGIGQLKDLKELILYGNELTSVPQEIGQMKNLKKLWLSKNKLRELPASIGQLKNLIWLDLRENNISRKEREKIRKLLANCKIKF
ncbi:MAG: leucine-rich repeat domain-containing protein [Spirochaetota bacterium]|nr:leucine-rich repeat domain-containing protein [Spirochaetota bacterium]